MFVPGFLAFVPLPVLLAVGGSLSLVTLYALVEFAFKVGICLAAAACCYFIAKHLMDLLTRIDREEVKFLSGALSVLVVMTSIVYLVNDNV